MFLDRSSASQANLRGRRKCLPSRKTALVAALTCLQASGGLHAEPSSRRTETPIKHLLVIIGENQSFDHVFATYRAPSGDHVSNLLSKRIIDINGQPGSNFAAGAQSSAVETGAYQLAPGSKQIYALLPPQTTGNLPTGASDTSGPPFATDAGALAWETMFYHQYAPLFDPHDMTVGASPFPKYVPDGRIADVTKLPNGPFQVTGLTPYDFYMSDMNHGFFPEWQEADCDTSHATPDNPSGCLNDLFPWVEATRNANGIGGGGVALGFYNVAHGDAPYFDSLAREYTLSDNYHQPMRGPSSPNWNFFGTADEIYFSDGHGNPAVPDSSLVMNPNPQSGVNNTPVNDAAFFVNCSDPTQPGVATIRSYLNSLPYHPDAHCAPGTYYHVASRRPGYYPDGTINTLPTALPPSSVPTIGERLSEKGISWSWYAGGYNRYKANTSDISPGYCDNCNPFQFSTPVMSTAESRAAHFHDAEELITDIRHGRLPEVAFLRSEDAPSGHPDSSKLSSFENYAKVFVNEMQAQPELWAETAILITFDEGGGFWDSGYVQPVDFFGDGVRVPMIVVSPYSRGGHVSHVYSDHASVVKFIERNWHLRTLSPRSRDNLPNPVTGRNPYIPVNAPAIGDLMDLFQFDHDHGDFGRDHQEFDQDQ
jgi:phospholipase C